MDNVVGKWTRNPGEEGNRINTDYARLLHALHTNISDTSSFQTKYMYINTNLQDYF